VTELEWERSIELRPMLEFLHGKISPRKFQLFAVACCRQHWELFCPQPYRQMVNRAEQFADGIGTDDELKALACVAFGPIPRELSVYAARCSAAAARETACCQFENPWVNAAEAADEVLRAVSCHRGLYQDEYSRDPHPEGYRQIALLYDIVGNPFLPMTFDQTWGTSTVVAMARRAYQSRDGFAMRILADALQDAGCEDEAILGHCRDANQVHARGCWLLDLILGKE